MFTGNTLTLVVDGPIANLQFSSQHSVNIFSSLAVDELSQALTELEALELEGLILSSDKKDFFLGADIAEFQPLFAQGEEPVKGFLQKNIDNLNRLEALPFPTVGCVNGMALGGGMELLLACDFRLAEPGAKLGLPEVKLGIIPGWGGTVRLPRLVGADTAIEWISSGKQFKAADALNVGVVDAVVAKDQLMSAARHIIAQVAAGEREYEARRLVKHSPLRLNPIEAGLAFESAKGFVAAKAGKNYPAPVAAIKAMQEAAPCERDEALAIEMKHFLSVALGSTAKALVTVFLSDQALMRKAKKWASQAQGKCDRAAVLGAGIMGGGIAYQSAVSGVPAVMKDVQQKGLDLGLAEASKLLAKQVERGRMDSKSMAEALVRINPTLGYEDFNQIDIAVEAVVENREIKQKVLQEVEQVQDESAVLASNTSTISISALAQSLARPERFCGMHFFNPVHAMPLVEVICGEKTSDETIARVVAYAVALGKKPVVVNDCPGFLVNRVLFPYFSGFAMLVRDGVDFQRIDRVMENFGWPMGPAYLLDVVGIDTAIHAEQVMAEGYPDRLQRDYTSITEQLFNQKLLGQKSKAGFYCYDTDKKGKPVKTVNPDAQKLAGETVNTDSPISDEQIVLRMMIPMVTEVNRCLQEGVVDSAAEADMAMLYGTGFPPHIGGVFHWVDQMGAAKLRDKMGAFEALGPLYQPAELLLEKAQQSASYY